MTLIGDTDGVSGRIADVPRVLRAERAASFAPADLAAAWQGLSRTALTDNPFFAPGFLEPAAAALGATVETISAWNRDGDLTGMMPLVSTRLGRIAPALAVWSHEFGPLGTPVVAADNAAASFRTLIAAALDRAGPARPVVFPDISADGPFADALVVAVEETGRELVGLEHWARAAIERSRDGADPWAALSRKRRKEHTRQKRRLGDIARVTLHHATSASDVAAGFEAFQKLEAASWKGRNETALASDPRIAAFARQAIGNLAARGAASILSLCVGDRPAAILVCLHEGHTALTWKIAHDETLARFSPGALLMLDAPALLFADQRTTLIDSLAAPDHPMIDHLWRGRRRMATLMLAPERRRWLTAIGQTSRASEHRLRTIARRLRTRPRTTATEEQPS